jgi:hypothetical protein
MDAAHGVSCNLPRKAVTAGAPMRRQGAGGSELALGRWRQNDGGTHQTRTAHLSPSMSTPCIPYKLNDFW